MHISEVYIKNFKLFEGEFTFELNEGLNILVGNDEAGKSTIIEAIHLALSGLFNGKYIKNELSQYLFNTKVVDNYINSLKSESPQRPPEIIIEIYLKGDNLALLEGNNNKKKDKSEGLDGFAFRIEFDENFNDEYEAFIKQKDISTLPIEYYKVSWITFAREEITPRKIPIKSALIDSSDNRFQNGSDIYISRIIKDFLELNEIVDISQAHRKMKETFKNDSAIEKINEKIQHASKISDKNVSISVELATKNAWENSLMTFFDKIPFNFIGKGEQSMY